MSAVTLIDSTYYVFCSGNCIRVVILDSIAFEVRGNGNVIELLVAFITLMATFHDYILSGMIKVGRQDRLRL